jgi:hypothetical protein
MAQGMQGVCLGYLKNTVFETRPNFQSDFSIL